MTCPMCRASLDGEVFDIPVHPSLFRPVVHKIKIKCVHGDLVHNPCQKKMTITENGRYTETVICTDIDLIKNAQNEIFEVHKHKAKKILKPIRQ